MQGLDLAGWAWARHLPSTCGEAGCWVRKATFLQVRTQIRRSATLLHGGPSRPVLSQRQNWAAGYESTKTSLNCTPFLRGLVPTYVHTRQTQGLPCHARQQPKASGNSKSSPSPPSHPHSCHPSCANTSTDEPQPPHPGDKHCAQLTAAGHLRKFRGRPRLGFCPTPTLLQAPGPAKWQGARGKETK